MKRHVDISLSDLWILFGVVCVFAFSLARLLQIALAPDPEPVDSPAQTGQWATWERERVGK